MSCSDLNFDKINFWNSHFLLVFYILVNFNEQFLNFTFWLSGVFFVNFRGFWCKKMVLVNPFHSDYFNTGLMRTILDDRYKTQQSVIGREKKKRGEFNRTVCRIWGFNEIAEVILYEYTVSHLLQPFKSIRYLCIHLVPVETSRLSAFLSWHISLFTPE